MRKSTRGSRRSTRKARRARLPVVTGGADKVVSSGGGMLLVAAARASGVDRALSEALAAWRQRLARHDPGKIVLDLAVALAMGGDCLADIAQLRSQPGVFGPVASDPTVSRLIDRLAADAPKALAAIASARATARARVWELAGDRAPDHAADADSPIVIDLDATLVTAHSEKELAAPNYKRGFGFHPIGAWVDHGEDGTGEALSMILRPGQRRIEHRRRPHRRHPAGAGPTTRCRRPAGPEGVDPHRRGGRHPRVPGLADPTAGAVLDRVRPDRNTGPARRRAARRGVDPGLRRRPPAAGRGVGRRTHRPGRPDRLAGGDAADRPRRTTPTPARNCGSPTPTGTGSPRSSPTPAADNWPTWNCGTAAAPAAKTASATRKTLA